MTDDPVNTVTRIGPNQLAIDECVICGREHRHGAGDADELRAGQRTHRVAHCKPALIDEDAPGGYWLELADDAEITDEPLGPKRRERILEERGYVFLDELDEGNISPDSTRRLEYVLDTLDAADELDSGLTWESTLWEDCTVEELLGALIEAGNLLDRHRRNDLDARAE